MILIRFILSGWFTHSNKTYFQRIIICCAIVIWNSTQKFRRLFFNKNQQNLWILVTSTVRSFRFTILNGMRDWNTFKIEQIKFNIIISKPPIATYAIQLLLLTYCYLLLNICHEIWLTFYWVSRDYYWYVILVNVIEFLFKDYWCLNRVKL